jgi:hypothetical protein
VVDNVVWTDSWPSISTNQKKDRPSKSEQDPKNERN